VSAWISLCSARARSPSAVSVETTADLRPEPAGPDVLAQDRGQGAYFGRRAPRAALP
jgi:hypothetical protein